MAKENRTYQDRAEYLIKAVAKRRRRLKEKAVEHKGGKCVFCGYSKYYGALDFHHIDPKEKEFGLSLNGITRSWKRVQKELDKCIIMCSNCHREFHAGLHEIPEEFDRTFRGSSAVEQKAVN